MLSRWDALAWVVLINCELDAFIRTQPRNGEFLPHIPAAFLPMLLLSGAQSRGSRAREHATRRDSSCPLPPRGATQARAKIATAVARPRRAPHVAATCGHRECSRSPLVLLFSRAFQFSRCVLR